MERVFNKLSIDILVSVIGWKLVEIQKKEAQEYRYLERLKTTEKQHRNLKIPLKSIIHPIFIKVFNIFPVRL